MRFKGVNIYSDTKSERCYFFSRLGDLNSRLSALKLVSTVPPLHQSRRFPEDTGERGSRTPPPPHLLAVGEISEGWVEPSPTTPGHLAIQVLVRKEKWGGIGHEQPLKLNDGLGWKHDIRCEI